MDIDIKFVYAGIGFLILLLFVLHTRRSSYSVKNGIFNLAEFKTIPPEIKREFSSGIIKLSNRINVIWNNASTQQRQDAIVEIQDTVNNLLNSPIMNTTSSGSTVYSPPSMNTTSSGRQII